MNEDFAPFELAVKLKEKGFDIPFYFFYRTDDKLIHHAMVTKPLVYCDKIDDEVVCAPTIPQVLKWLREKKKMHIIVEIADSGWYYTIYPNIRWGNGKLKCDKYIMSFKNKESYEQAALAGIDYCLDNLI